jgi:hypothetical protein
MIELEQFTRIIRTVTNGDVTVRECRMIFFDVGLDYLDIETFLQITHAYHLRSLHVVPPVLLPPQDLQLLQNSLGRFYIHSTERVYCTFLCHIIILLLYHHNTNAALL